jgi:hypothetical protein
MKKFYYRLFTKGKKHTVIIAGQSFKLPKGKEWDALYPSEEKYVVAPNEDVARFEIRQKMKGKWDAFILIRKD